MKKSKHQKAADNNCQPDVIKEEFTGKNMTRFGGSGLIRRFLKRHKIKDLFERKVIIEDRKARKYPTGTMFVSCLYGIFLGYTRPYHMKVLSTDRVFQRFVGLLGFPVQSSISRFLSRIRVGVSRQIACLNFDFLMKFRKGFSGFKSITLDLDSHVMPVYGKQQRAGLGYNPKKKGRKSYHPLLCFIGETRDYIGGVLRSGKHHTSYNAVGFLKGIWKKLPAHIKEVRLRADSGFFSRQMIKFLMDKGIEFYIVVPIQPWVQREIRQVSNWTPIGGGVETGECGYVFNKDVTLRMVVIRERVRRNSSPRKQLKLLNTEDITYDYQVILTNSTKEAQDVWRYYNQRACCENFIKEGIYGFGLDKVVSHNYGGNCAWFELLMFGYNLMNFFKEEVLNQKKQKNMIQTIRDRLFLIPGKLVYSSRQYVLKLERSWAYKAQYEEALARLT